MEICREETLSKPKCMNTSICLSVFKPIQVRTANYRHLWSTVDPLMLGGSKSSYIFRFVYVICVTFSYHQALIKGLKLIYRDRNFVTLN